MKLLVFNVPSDQRFYYPNWTHAPKTIFRDSNADLSIRTMSLPELVATRENWLVSEGWPGIRNTLAATYASDPEGFYFLQKDGNKIASISVVTYPEIQFAYIGFYVVTKPFRGQGYGKLLLKSTVEYSQQKRNITTFGLNCIESAQAMYSKYGFEVVTIDDFWKFTQTTSNTAEKPQDTAPSEITSDLLTEIINYDAVILGAHRRAFLSNFLLKPGTRTVIALSADKINGYGVISVREPAASEPNNSFKLGPLYADDHMIAKQILSELLATPNFEESIYLETPGNNQQAAQLVESLGFIRTGQQAKMFKGTPPKFIVPKMFCYSSIAIGG